MIFHEYEPYIPKHSSGAFREIQDGVQEGRRRIDILEKFCKLVNSSSIFLIYHFNY